MNETTFNDLDTIAKVIGYHFWNCKSDQEAINCGMDCAREILKAQSELRKE